MEDWMRDVELRTAVPSDVPAMLALLRSTSEEGDALPFVDGLDADFVDGQWLRAKGCVVACSEGTLLGMYRYGAAMPGRGAHVCTATFVVARAARGRGIGRALVVHCLDAAQAAGFRAMQFNQVVSTNRAALALYRSLGFTEVGCIPGAFRHDRLGDVPAYIMYRSLV
jgi:ribosomal protein S18 acetylase RimI-like enzyme